MITIKKSASKLVFEYQTKSKFHGQDTQNFIKTNIKDPTTAKTSNYCIERLKIVL